MKGEETFDGKISGNRQLVDRYNEAKGKKPAKGAKHPKETGGESGGAHAAAGHDEDIRAVVAEHGPAHSSHVLDRGEGHPDGRFHVISHHEDGHVHHADHEDMSGVHEHLAAAHEAMGGDLEDGAMQGEGEEEESFSGAHPESIASMGSTRRGLRS